VELSAFGLGLLSDVTPPGAWEERTLDEPVVRLRATSSSVISESWSGMQAIGWEGTVDGAKFVVERGLAGDHRFVHRSSAIPAVQHLSADASELRYAPSDRWEASSWRVVLDSVLFTVALLHGYEALHAAAVATPDADGVIAITAASGGGKSTLLSELLLRGLALMADDVLVLERSSVDGSPLAHPAPPLVTVPSVRMSTLRDSLPGVAPETIATVRNESWIAVPTHPLPLPLRSLVVLNRRPGLATGLHAAEKPLAILMESLLGFPRTHERERSRFEMAGAVAAHVPIWRLDADPSVDPAVLTDLLLAQPAAPQARIAASLA
jgi:hypothetical protein